MISPRGQLKGRLKFEIGVIDKNRKGKRFMRGFIFGRLMDGMRNRAA